MRQVAKKKCLITCFQESSSVATAIKRWSVLAEHRKRATRIITTHAYRALGKR